MRILLSINRKHMEDK